MQIRSALPLPSTSARCLRLIAAAVAVIAQHHAAAAVLIGYTDTFSAGASGWINGENANSPPLVVSSGGPAGASDAYLSLVTSGTHNTQSRLVTFNNSANWTGNFVAAGATAIEMDFKNFGDIFGAPITLEMRIAIKEGPGGSPGYASVLSFTVPSDGKWHHASFSILPADLVAIGSPTLSLEELLKNPAEIRILHSFLPAVKGDLVEGQVTLGIDNIRIVPEPATGALLLASAAFAICRRRRLTR